MFYITAHTVTQNQFADIVTDHQLPNSEQYLYPDFAFTSTDSYEKNHSIILLPGNFDNSDQIKSPEKDFDLHEIIADGLRFDPIYY